MKPGITTEEWRRATAARIKQEEREHTNFVRRQRRRQKLTKRGLEWIVKKGWVCIACRLAGHDCKIGSWSKAHAHVKSDKHIEVELLAKLSQ